MSLNNIALSNFAAGELSPKIRGRFNLPIYFNGAERQKNFISETQGPAKFRTGTRFVNHTRSNNTAVFIPFQFNDEQSYILEFTENFMRIFKDEGFITNADTTITGITQADPGVVTDTAHGYSDGDEVFISGVVGMTEVNGKTFIVANKNANDFELTDVDGNNVDTSGFTAYSSGGTAASIVEVATPYKAADLAGLKFDQNADTMYIAHPNFEPRKLTRTSNTAWTLAIYSRTSDPFTTQVTITGISQADPGVVTATAHGFSDGDKVIIETVVGMTEVNGLLVTVANKATNTFELTDRDGNNIDTSGFTAYSSAGYASNQNLLPSTVGFYEGRLAFGFAGATPEKIWISRAPTTAGVPRYDDYTTGSNADDAVVTVLTPQSGKVNKIQWFAGTDRLLAIGTFGDVTRLTGSPDDTAIAPDSISAKSAAPFGCNDAMPIKRGSTILYIQQGGLVIRSFEFDVLADAFTATDRNLVSDHITESGILQIAFQNGRPDVLWAVRNDGVLLGLTFKAGEDVSGWHRHIIGGTDVKVLSVGVIPMTAALDQVWVVVERTINSVTRRYVEFLEDDPVWVEPIDFFTDDSTESADDTSYRNRIFEQQKDGVYVDSALTYDGSAQTGTMTPGATTGSSINFTSSVAVFASTDVGREIWVKSTTGAEEGRAEITSFTSTTVVVCTIKKDFSSTDAIAAGNWYLTAASMSGLDHLEGETVTVIADGGDHPDATVSSGAITLDAQHSKVHVGLGYVGLIKTMNLEAGSAAGPGQTKFKNINRVGVKFLNTLGARVGTDPYNMENVVFRSSADFTNRPPPLFSGSKPLFYPDRTAEEKHVIVEQRKPLPCTVQMIVPHIDTSDD